MIEISQLWYSKSEADWKLALGRYWDYLRPENLELERRMNNLSLGKIAALDSVGWYRFLLDEYFRWKYTAPNRYATTTRHLRKYVEADQLEELFAVKKVLTALDVSDIRAGLSAATKIKGLGIAGASGLLSLMYPQAFATVDQFVVMALRRVPGLPEGEALNRMKPDSLTLPNGVVLINLMRRKAEENNRLFANNYWNPRKIDMVLWGTREVRAKCQSPAGLHGSR